jgi:hypothetical protein
VEPRLAGLSAEQRDALASAWHRDALDFQAGIASCTYFALDLLMVGAPPDLLRAAHRTNLDQVAHAERCFALASVYAGRELTPLAPRFTLRPSDRVTLRATAELAVRDGCVKKTVRSMVLSEAADRCQDPVVASVLRRIATDLVRHAGVAWRFVGWALASQQDLHLTVRDAFVQAAETVATTQVGPAHGLSAWGRLSPSDQAQIAQRCITSVVTPFADGLETRSFPDAARLMQR